MVMIKSLSNVQVFKMVVLLDSTSEHTYHKFVYVDFFDFFLINQTEGVVQYPLML